MKQTKRLKLKWAAGIGKLRFVPVGYFSNRPMLLRTGAIGRLESVKLYATPR